MKEGNEKAERATDKGIKGCYVKDKNKEIEQTEIGGRGRWRTT